MGSFINGPFVLITMYQIAYGKIPRMALEGRIRSVRVSAVYCGYSTHSGADKEGLDAIWLQNGAKQISKQSK